jgi:hypothetical protein
MAKLDGQNKKIIYIVSNIPHLDDKVIIFQYNKKNHNNKDIFALKTIKVYNYLK